MKTTKRVNTESHVPPKKKIKSMVQKEEKENTALMMMSSGDFNIQAPAYAYGMESKVRPTMHFPSIITKHSEKAKIIVGYEEE